MNKEILEELPFQNYESKPTEASLSMLDNSEMDFCIEPCREMLDNYVLIDSLVKDILILEEEMIRWRQALLRYLSPLDAQNLLSDIFDNLAQRHYDDKTYQTYLQLLHNGQDPMESEEHTQLLWRLRNGEDETSVVL